MLKEKQGGRTCLIIAALLLAASTIPNIGIELNTFGFYWNLYRVMVVLLSLVTLFIFRGEVSMAQKGSFRKWMVFLFFWFVYGVISLVVSPYADPHRGLQELLSVFCGMLCFYIFSNLHLNEKEIEQLLRLLFFLLLGLILLGFWEIQTGQHLPTSKFEDTSVRNVISIYSATGIMYNVNDFSALITLICPVVIGRFRIKLHRWFLDPGWLLVAGVVEINRVNEANICNLAVIFGIFIYIVMETAGNRRWLSRICLAFTILVAVALIYIFYIGGKGSGLVGRVTELVEQAESGTGGLRSRLLIYVEGLALGPITGFLGIGPAGYPVYYTAHFPESKFINPHALVLEIYSEYGLLIAFGFIFLLVTLAIRMYRIFRAGKGRAVGEWGRIGVLWIIMYLITSFAPSSYLLYTLQWTLVALICLMERTAGELLPVTEKEERGSKDEKNRQNEKKEAARPSWDGGNGRPEYLCRAGAAQDRR